MSRDLGRDVLDWKNFVQGNFGLIFCSLIILVFCFASWISTRNSGQMILRNFGECHITPLGQKTKLIS